MPIKEKTCDICGQTDFEKICIKNKHSLWKCNNCLLVFVYPQPSEKELSDAYSYKTGYFENTDFVEGNLNLFYKKIFEKKENGSFLDIGSGMGEVVYTAKACGWKAEGIDLNKDAVEKAVSKGLDIKCVNIDDFDGIPESYDVINMGDLIEHVKNPRDTLKRAYTLLKKDGDLIISTPNVNSFLPKYTFLVSKIFRIVWAHPSPPYHLFEFSNENFPVLLEQEGFKIESIKYKKIPLAYTIGNTGFFNNFKHNYKKNKSLFISIKENSILNSILLIIIFVLYLPGYMISKFFPVKDHMVIIIRKK